MPDEKFIYDKIEQVKMSQCIYCKHKGNGKYCDAFDTIPQDILDNKTDHRQPIKGDRGIQFEPNKGIDPKRLDRLFE